MKVTFRLVAICLLLLSAEVVAATTPFHWQWRRMEENFWQRPILRQMKIRNDDRVAIIDAVAASLKLDKDSSEDIGDAQLYDIASNESYEWIDLDGDGAPELITQAFGVDWCGAVGNCALQVFRRHGNKFDLVLRTSAQRLMIDRSGKKPLLVLYTHESAIEGDLAVYSFPKGAKAANEYHYSVRWADPAGEVAYTHPHLEALPLIR